MKPVAQEATEVRMSTNLKLLSGQPMRLQAFLLNALMNALNRKIKFWLANDFC